MQRLDNHLRLDEANGLIAKEQLYFIVGLSNGINENPEQNLYLPFDMVRYLDYLARNDGLIMLFDAPNIGGGLPDSVWEKACGDMRNRIQCLIDAFEFKELKVLKASEAIDKDRFIETFESVRKIVIQNSDIAEKMWQIVPPSARLSENLDAKCKISNLTSEEKERAFKLMEYEMQHVAAILANDGTKILHGRSEERSAQIVKILAENFSDETSCLKWQGNIMNPSELKDRRLDPEKYPLPYRLADIKSVEEINYFILSFGQIPLIPSIHLGDSIFELSRLGKKDLIRKYLLNNFRSENDKILIDQLDFEIMKDCYILASFLVNKIIWPVERKKLEKIKENSDPVLESKAMLQVLNIQSDICLSPFFKTIIEKVMPTYYGKCDMSDLKVYLKWLIEGIVGPFSICPDSFERDMLQHCIYQLSDIYNILGGDELELSKNPNWINIFFEIDADLNHGKLTSVLMNNAVSMKNVPEIRTQESENLKYIAGVNYFDMQFDNISFLSPLDMKLPENRELRKTFLLHILMPYFNKTNPGVISLLNRSLGTSTEQMTISLFFENFLIESATCSANSLVGVKINA